MGTKTDDGLIGLDELVNLIERISPSTSQRYIHNLLAVQ